jgi:hypothetical protein
MLSSLISAALGIADTFWLSGEPRRTAEAAELGVLQNSSNASRNDADLVVPQSGHAATGLGNVPVDIVFVLAEKVHPLHAKLYISKQLSLDIDREQDGPPQPSASISQPRRSSRALHLPDARSRGPIGD